MRQRKPKKNGNQKRDESNRRRKLDESSVSTPSNQLHTGRSSVPIDLELEDKKENSTRIKRRPARKSA
jgi:hypothetical protein